MAFRNFLQNTFSGITNFLGGDEEEFNNIAQPQRVDGKLTPESRAQLEQTAGARPRFLGGSIETFKEFVSPKTASKTIGAFGKEVLHDTTRNVASAGLSVMNPILRTAGQQPINIGRGQRAAGAAGTVQDIFFGGEPIQDFRTRTERFKEEHSTLAGPGGTFALPFIAAGAMLDLTGSGKGTKVFPRLTTKILDSLRNSKVVSKQFITDQLKRFDIRGVEKKIIEEEVALFGNKVPTQEFIKNVEETRLLPLERTDVLPNRMFENEGVVLPTKLRGNVADYSEHIYQSPIKTSAGNIHFLETDYPNYFAHTRIEDLTPSTFELKLGEGVRTPPTTTNLGLPVGDTRRVIEIQGDLFQKGRLEIEFTTRQRRIAPLTDEVDLITKDRFGNTVTKPKGETLAKLEGEKVQLQPYRNTWHERIIREEVKQAAIDGKTKLQFPTGETIGKIEGWGSETNWAINVPQEGVQGGMWRTVTSTDLKVGQELRQGAGELGSSHWIVTNILEDGNFKAMPKKTFDILQENLKKRGKDFFKEFYTPGGEMAWRGLAENFNISGGSSFESLSPELKNVYKFYENDISKFVKNKFDAKLIIDPQGLKWMEIDIPKSAATEPVLEFGKASIGALAGIGAAAGVAGAGAVFLGGDKKEFDNIVQPKRVNGKLTPESRIEQERIAAGEGQISIPRENVDANNILEKKELPKDYTKQDAQFIGGMLFAESTPYQAISNKDLRREMSAIAQTVLNRADNWGVSPREVIERTNQVGAHDYQYLDDTNLSAMADRYRDSNPQNNFEKQKSKMAFLTINEMRNDKLENEIEGRDSYAHSLDMLKKQGYYSNITDLKQIGNAWFFTMPEDIGGLGAFAVNRI